MVCIVSDECLPMFLMPRNHPRFSKPATGNKALGTPHEDMHKKSTIDDDIGDMTWQIVMIAAGSRQSLLRMMYDVLGF